MGLGERLRAEIAAGGPISVADYMARCLFDPEDGYYATRPALGEDGDFITAPLVSQMFGELIGLWAAETWSRLGRPPRVLLVEMGPGDGTLMSDALRAARLAPEFINAAELWLVEPSDPLRSLQEEALAGATLSPSWSPDFAHIPDGAPLIVLANELLDCLPARQFLRTDKGWAERMVGLDAGGALDFGLVPSARPDGAPEDLAPGLVWEISPAQRALGGEIGGRIARNGGAALFIDYGRGEPGPGDTLQALRRHGKVSPFSEPGSADLTVWADFPAFLAEAREAGAATALLDQGELLRRLGVAERARRLAEASPARAPVIARQLARLVEPDQMGQLFKAAAIWSKAAPPPPGFEDFA